MMRLLILLAGFALPALAYAQGTDFIPLLPSLPGITEVSSADSIAPLLSQIYKICIGVAAVLAVLQIMYAGVLYMGGDSVTEKKDARARIGMALAGLLLVLSPVIVFSIINPEILNLDIGGKNLKTTAGSGIEDFKPTSPTTTTAPKTDNGNASLGGGATAPTPKIQATGADNTTCKTVQDGEIIADNDTKKAYCCMSQTSATVSCTTDRRINSDLSMTMYCSCKKK